MPTRSSEKDRPDAPRSSVKRRPAVMWIWYRGGGFHGFQSLPVERTVQGILKAALLELGIDLAPQPAGRTDKGVHARMQVVSLRLPLEAEPGEIATRLNALLPDDMGIAAAAWAPGNFHAQWSAEGKDYRYRLVLSPAVRFPPAWRGCVWNVPEDPAFSDGSERAAGQLGALTEESLRARLAEIPGRRQFLPFHAKSSVAKQREIWSCELRALGGAAEGVFEIVLRGSAFGRFMVRYLVGGAVAAASGLISHDTWRAALEEDVAFPGLRAEARGLVLWEVLYPEDRRPFAGVAPLLPADPPFGAG